MRRKQMMEPQFLVDAAGKATAVVIPIEDFRALLERLEDLDDCRLADQRRKLPRIDISSLEELLAQMEAQR